MGLASGLDIWHGLWPCYSCCRELWVPLDGTFGAHCIDIIGHVPSWTAISIVLLRYLLSPIWRYRPVWLRKFATEDNDQHRSSSLKGKSWSTYSTCLATTLALALVLGLYHVVGRGLSPIHICAIIPSFLSLVILAIERPRTFPGSIFVIQSCLFGIQLLLIITAPEMLRGRADFVSLGETVMTMVNLVIMLNMPMRDPKLATVDISAPFTQPTSSLRSPEDLVTMWQWMTISWMAPLIAIGKARQIQDEDVWFLPFEFQHSRLHQLFRDVKGSVTVRLLKTNGPDLILTTLLGVLEVLAQFGQVILLKQMLASLNAEEVNFRVTATYATFILLARLVQDQSSVFGGWFQRRCYERSRGEMITMVYEKTLRRKAFTFPSEGADDLAKVEVTPSGALLDTDSEDGDVEGPEETEAHIVTSTAVPSLFQGVWSRLRRTGIQTNATQPLLAPLARSVLTQSPASTGKILNLMRNDVYEVSQRFWEFSGIVTKPLNFVLSVVLIWRYLGPTSLLGMAFLLLAQLVNAFIIRSLLRIERERRAITDKKLQLTSQFVEAIRHLRWYDWQDSWLQQILASRQAELSKRVVSSVLSKVIVMINQIGAYLVPVTGFWAYTSLLGKPLTVDIAFPALDLFGLLQTSAREIPDLITVLLNARVAMGRIEAFMAEPDKEVEDGETVRPSGDLKIEMREASFSWPGSEKTVLERVSFVCEPGLTVVCGKVGIGKTALLQAILGELDQSAGERSVPDETVGYCAQTPWLESMSIRDNILFCQEYDERRYKQVLDACCLIPDLENFKAGDLSMIGENGIGLSGGQKARVALARALYSRARIVLLDDPIAALDHQTAETILGKLFANGYSSLTAGRLVVFVTHRVDLITHYANQVLDLVEGGRIKTISREELETNEEIEKLAAEGSSYVDTGDANDKDNIDAAVPDKLIEEEYRAEGGVMFSVYGRYIRAGSLWWWSALIAAFVLFRIFRVWYFWFLKQWGEAYTKSTGADSLYFASYQGQSVVSGPSQSPRTYHEPITFNSTGGSDWFNLDLHLPNPSDNVNPWIVWFFIISISQMLAQTLTDFILIIIVYRAGKRLFADVMRRVSNAKFRFYDVTPVGRLMNRLTSDIGTIDGQIAGQVMLMGWWSISWASSVIVIATTTPLFLILTIIMSLIFVFIFMRFLPASQSLRRLEMVSLSPLMSNFGTLLEGLTTVRAFKAQPDFQNRIVATTDNFQKMDHFYWSLQSWLTYRFDLLSAFATFTLTMTALATGLSAGAVGFVLAAAGGFVTATHSICKTYGQLQMQFVSVERVIELLDLDQEEEEGQRKPRASWPSYDDDIVFNNVTLRYAENLDPSLTGVSFRIPAGSTVAVTGRTGSGKSTLALALLGTVLPDPDTGGIICIGDQDIATVDKHALRRSITFVAQDPVLFPGSLRENLDPLREHSDEECVLVLSRVLRDGASGVFCLNSRVDGGGKNLSQGQRQLIGLGRAVLRRSPVVILDEATASIDMETAFYIQQVLREELKASTVITIAHRVEAVKDADYRIVLDKGRVVESGPV